MDKNAIKSFLTLIRSRFMNSLHSPFLGKIKDVKEQQILIAFNRGNSSTPNCVTTLSLASGGFIDATTGDHEDSFLVKRKLSTDSSPLICKQLLKREEVILLFTELLSKKVSSLNKFEWEKNEYNFGKKSSLLITVFLFIVFNIGLFIAGYYYMNEQKKQESLKASAVSTPPISTIEYEILKLDNKWVIRNKKSGLTKPLNIKLPLKDQMP